jgi:DnaJ-class molecular chaperone
MAGVQMPVLRVHRLCWPLIALLSGVQWRFVVAQMQFEIPAEMLQGMMGGGMMMGGGGQQRKTTEWPKSENSEVAPEFQWLTNTEWKGKTAKYLLLRDGIVESPLKECEHEGMCLWAANNNRVLINTPTLKVIKFTIDGLDKADKKKLDNKEMDELKKLKLVTEKASKSGKRSELEFDKIATAANEDSVPAQDLYKVLDVAEDADQSAIKSKFRRMSVQNHPDKGGDPKLFNEIREAYEVLSDQGNRRYYDIGGAQLVKNVENLNKEAEGQKAQLDAQLNQVPKNHPQRAMFEAQIAQQKRQFESVNMKSEIEKKLRNEDIEVSVPISAQELYNGVSKKEFEFKRLVICRGCRADPTSDACRECGRCPPEKVQVPKYGNTPFGRQVVGVKEKEQESMEKCREVPMKIEMRVSKGAKEGSSLKSVPDIGHQTPGKIPGRVVFKVHRGSPDDTYTIAENDLHTVIRMTMQQAIFGFSFSWTHLGDETVTLSRDKSTTPDEVIRLPKKGLGGSSRGDLYVRLALDMGKIEKGTKSLTFEAPSSKEKVQPQLFKEEDLEIRDGSAWRRWVGRENAKTIKDKKSKEEL